LLARSLFDINVGIAEVQAVLRDEQGKFFGASQLVSLVLRRRRAPH